GRAGLQPADGSDEHWRTRIRIGLQLEGDPRADAWRNRPEGLREDADYLIIGALYSDPAAQQLRVGVVAGAPDGVADDHGIPFTRPERAPIRRFGAED